MIRFLVYFYLNISYRFYFIAMLNMFFYCISRVFLFIRIFELVYVRCIVCMIFKVVKFMVKRKKY